MNFRWTNKRGLPSAPVGAETFEGDPSKVTLYKDIENGIAAPGVKLPAALL